MPDGTFYSLRALKIGLPMNFMNFRNVDQLVLRLKVVKYLIGRTPIASLFINACSSSRPNISQFGSLKIKRLARFICIRNVVRRTMRFEKCESFGRVATIGYGFILIVRCSHLLLRQMSREPKV